MKHRPMAHRKRSGQQPPARSEETSQQQGSPKVEGGSSPAFDLFLDRGLHELYDEMFNEPLPEAWLRLIEEDRKK